MTEIITKFEAYLLTEKRVSKNTFDAYKRDLSQFAHFLENNNIFAFSSALKDNLKKFLYDLHKEGISPRSISRKISTFKAFFKYVAEYHGHPDLGKDLTFPKLEKKLPEYLKEDEINAVLHALASDTSVQADRNKLLIYLLYVSGMRVSELSELRISDIQFETGLMTVTGKGGKQRVIPLVLPVLEMIRTYVQKIQSPLPEKGKKRTDLLFPITYGSKIKSISRQTIWVMVKNAVKRAGIERSISPHTFRHSLATHMLQNGANIRSLQLLLGHENISTVQIYTHVDTSYLRKIYDKKHPRS